MGILSQPPVGTLPSDIDLSGLVAVVTGASAGLGLETARQLLQHKASTVILAVRNLSKGEQCKQALLADPVVRKSNPHGKIDILKLDVADNESIKTFASSLQQQYPIVNLLVLNAGAATIKYQSTTSGHEHGLQVFYLSNVLLINLLLPHLEQSTAHSTRISRITWIGSRAGWKTAHSLRKRPVAPAQNVLAHFDAPAQYSMSTNYSDAKLLCYMYVRELAPRMDTAKCTVTMLCPGMVNTNISDVLPFYLRSLMNAVKAVRARPVPVGGWIVMNAAVVVGQDGHGKMLFDKDEGPGHEFVDSVEGRVLQERLWTDTMGEMRALVQIPKALS